MDFSTFRPLDPQWYRRLNWLLNAMHAENEQHLLLALHTQHCAALSASPKAYEHHWAQAAKLLELYRDILMPWDSKTAGDQPIKESLREQWIAAFGDPEDPEVKERIQKTVDFLKGGSKPAPVVRTPRAVRPKHHRVTKAHPGK